MAKAYMNLYRQGWYHRAGKPGTLSIHPGDMYPTRSLALADIDHAAPYIGTVEVNLGDQDFLVYPSRSEPTPLRESRKWFGTGGGYSGRFDAIAEAEQAALEGEPR